MITASALRRFFSTPKGLLILILVVLAGAAAPGEGLRVVAPGLLAGVGAAAAIDLVFLRIRNKAWEFPDGAVLTGLFIAMVLSPHVPWHVSALASAIGIVSKYVLRGRSANVFNPAALALVVVFYTSGAGQNWWGALAELPPAALILLVGTGVFIADRVNKMPSVLTFLGVYYLLFTVRAFAGAPERVVEVFRAPDLHMALFFAFFILTDPPTSPPRYRAQIFYSLIVAVTSYAFFEFVGSVYFLLAGVLAGNLWEAYRRRRAYAAPSRAVPAGRASSPAMDRAASRPPVNQEVHEEKVRQI